MFDGITTEGQGGGRRASSFAVSVVVHGGVIALVLVASIVKANLPKEEAVAVVFKAPPPPPPPPPPPAGKKKSTPRETPKRPITPKVPNQIIQPKEVPKTEAPPEPAPDDGADEDEGVEGGVEGGVVGGVVGGVLGGTLGGTLGGDGEGPPVLLGAGMSRPQPTAECRPSKPAAPEQARQMGITGLVLVEYVVHSDGHVGEVNLKNPTAPPILFEAVKSWLLGCPFKPSLSGSKPIAVKIIQPFTFKSGQ